ncbi:MAG TPA: hypothetical protein P5217_06590 [Methanoregulaceae archaeon]|nr:hypothetical protein [Methanoregulaceae archaeon]
MATPDLKSLDEERSEKQKSQPRGMSLTSKLILGVIGIIVILLIVAFLTIGVTTTAASEGASFPYTTTYGVSFPEGETITIGNTHILVLSYENEMVADIDGDREKLVVGETREMSPRHAKVTVLGTPFLETDFQIFLTYKGVRDNRAYFDLTVKTENQVPDFLLRRLLPSEIDARPV